MYVALTTLKPPAVEPVSVDLARQHIRIDHTDDDNLLAIYITAARTLAENYLGRCLISQQLRYSISDAPPGPQWPLTAVTPVILPLWLPYPLVFQKPIKLPRAPVLSIDNVQISNTGQLLDQVLTAQTDYTFDITGAPARLLLAPSAQPALGQHCIVDFTAGYDDTGETVPPLITTAILFGAAYFYENRGDDATALPEAFYALLTPYRLVSWGT